MLYDSSLVFDLKTSDAMADISKYGKSLSCPSGCPSYQADGSMYFDGAYNQIEVATYLPEITSTLSLFLWIKPGSSQKQYADILGCHGQPSGRVEGWSFEQDPTNTNKYWFLIGNRTAWVNAPSTVNLTSDVWTYLTVIKTPTNCTIYQDGIAVMNYSCPTDIYPCSDHVFSVGQSYITGRQWKGYMGELRIYNSSFTPEEVAVLYTSQIEKYNSTEYRFYDNITNLTQGTYTYSAWANDTFGNSAGSETRTLTYDSSYPVVQLVTANNAVWTASSGVNFVYNVSQNLSGINYCNLTVNDSVLNSSSSITKNTNQTLYANLVNGVYNWSVNCTGQNGLMNWSTTYNVSVVTTTTITTTTITTTTPTTTTTTMASFCSLGLDCGSCTGWAYINATSGTLQALDADENGKYDRVCCGGIVSNYTVL